MPLQLPTKVPGSTRAPSRASKPKRRASHLRNPVATDMSRRTRTLGAGLALFMSYGAYATTTVGVDVLSHLQRERAARVGGASASSPPVSELLNQLLVSPTSPYSETVDAPGLTNDVDWPDVLARLPGEVSSASAVAVLHWDLGLTRARPGRDVEPRNGYRD